MTKDFSLVNSLKLSLTAFLSPNLFYHSIFWQLATISALISSMSSMWYLRPWYGILPWVYIRQAVLTPLIAWVLFPVQFRQLLSIFSTYFCLGLGDKVDSLSISLHLFAYCCWSFYGIPFLRLAVSLGDRDFCWSTPSIIRLFLSSTSCLWIKCSIIWASSRLLIAFEFHSFCPIQSLTSYSIWSSVFVRAYFWLTKSLFQRFRYCENSLYSKSI